MHLELSFRPTIQLITIVRHTVSNLYERILGDADASDRIALATHELLENTLRHSTDGNAFLNIRVDQGPPRVTIETRNRATEEKIAGLVAQAAEMNSRDATDYFIDIMGRCAARDEDGGLGLARIRAEAEMNISVETEGDCVTIIASTTKLGAVA